MALWLASYNFTPLTYNFGRIFGEDPWELQWDSIWWFGILFVFTNCVELWTGLYQSAVATHEASPSPNSHVHGGA